MYLSVVRYIQKIPFFDLSDAEKTICQILLSMKTYVPVSFAQGNLFTNTKVIIMTRNATPPSSRRNVRNVTSLVSIAM